MKIEAKVEAYLAAGILITVLILFGKYHQEYEPKDVSATIAPIATNR